MAGLKYPGSLALCTAKTGLMVVTKCLLALRVGQKVSAEIKRPKLPSSTLREGCQILQVEVSGACKIADTSTKALCSLGGGSSSLWACQPAGGFCWDQV